MNWLSPSPFPRLMLLAALCAPLAGCLFKPTTLPTRSFVLTGMPAAAPPSAAASLPVGVGPVRMPPYLSRSAIAWRKNSNEISYLENALWAEPLDQSFQRAMAANLAILLPSDQIRLSSWQRTDVAVAVHVHVEQFDVNAQGRGTLHAWWRIVAPDGGRILKSGRSQLARNTQTTDANPEAWVATLSELTIEFSQALAQAIRESAPAVPPAKQPSAGRTN